LGHHCLAQSKSWKRLRGIVPIGPDLTGPKAYWARQFHIETREARSLAAMWPEPARGGARRLAGGARASWTSRDPILVDGGGGDSQQAVLHGGAARSAGKKGARPVGWSPVMIQRSK
jgi:hypothetical protein